MSKNLQLTDFVEKKVSTLHSMKYITNFVDFVI